MKCSWRGHRFAFARSVRSSARAPNGSNASGLSSSWPFFASSFSKPPLRGSAPFVIPVFAFLFFFFFPLAVSYFRSGSLQRSIFVFSSFRISPPPMNDSESVVLTSMRLSVYRLPFSITYLAAMRDAFLSAVEDRRKREANRRQAVAAAKPNHSSFECSRRRMPPEAKL